MSLTWKVSVPEDALELVLDVAGLNAVAEPDEGKSCCAEDRTLLCIPRSLLFAFVAGPTQFNVCHRSVVFPGH